MLRRAMARSGTAGPIARVRPSGTCIRAHPHPHPHAHPHRMGRSRPRPRRAVPPAAAAQLDRDGRRRWLVPSPSALLVLLVDRAGRPWFGLLLVVAYGLGMAGLLTGIGLLLARGRALLERRARTGAGGPRWPLAGRLTRVLPVGTAALVLVVGIGVALTAARNLTG
jgi:ABC-type nickel/cobalt efflux system permease component RcnA